MNKFNRLVKAVDDNIDCLNYIITPDNKLVLVAEHFEDVKHYVKTWNNIKSHDDAILGRLDSNEETNNMANREKEIELAKKACIEAYRNLSDAHSWWRYSWEERCEKDSQK